MPYPKPIKRAHAETHGPADFPELAYVLQKECVRYMKRDAWSTPSRRDVLAALNEVNLEVHRRYMGPWSDDAIRRNGDIT